MVTAEKPGSRVSHITLDRKRAGKPIAGNRHDGFEVAGAGTQLTVLLVRHSQRKRGATDRRNLRSMALDLAPTRINSPIPEPIGRRIRLERCNRHEHWLVWKDIKLCSASGNRPKNRSSTVMFANSSR